ncbi:DUF2059 domain-containing protein [Brevundimonas sp. AJA228-03]|uniref:DUF2059 domain-containing protein n=1 Tax=Brevundimonas sp. AJA228-03 TaxID=2752515 RepID=UPI001ADF04F6|nr:DUF2059 domain-containing protein [Brevundimonas sp. AJA228-03]QTN18440.1 DUF2059 domain-containing protein [Brevundimonas sp. AJA228-03]
MRFLIFAGALLFLGLAPAAQAQTSDADVRAELAERLIAVTARDNLDKMLSDATEQMLASQSESTEEQQAWTRANVPDLLAQNLEAMIDRTEELYAERFTVRELRALVEFYESPAGRVIANKQNELGVEMGEELLIYMRGFFADYRAKYCAAFDCPSATNQFNRGKD